MRVLDYAVTTGADAVVHGGDFFFRSRVAPHIVDAAYQALWTCADAGIPIFIVPGNHERSVLPPSLLLAHPEIRVFDEPRTFVLDVRGTRVALCGFPNDRNDIRRTFETCVAATGHRSFPADVKLLCMHQTAAGAVVGPGHFEFKHGPDVIGRRQVASLRGEFDAVLSGHIHRHQVLSYDGLPLFYCGSVERTSFAEKDEIKGFLDLEIRSVSEATIALRFEALRTRPMMDVEIDPHHRLSNQRGLFERDVAPRAIVRLRSTKGPYRGGALTRNVLARLFPPDTIVQLHPSLFASGTRRADTAARSSPSRRSTDSDAGAPSA